MNPEKSQKIEGWFAVAEKDLQVAEVLILQSLWAYDILCFHCHQCVEKYLKALLVYYDVEPPKVHDVRQLLAMLLPLDEEVLSLQDAVDLNDYAVRYRYPDHLEIDDKQIALRAISLAKEVESFVKRKINL
ncbi:MAG: HEPN domain-containing protein [Bacteroidota bacterium]|nr:HEPN domain-containing protein [Bacteroidota bacterium]